MQSNGQGGFFNLVSIAMLVLAMLVVVLALAIFVNPNSAFNPFPPQANVRPSPTIFVPPTLTATLPIPTLPPTWTPSYTPTRLPTVTSINTVTVTPTATGTTTLEPTFTITLTPTSTEPTSTPTPTSTTTSFAYSLNSSSPTYDTHTIGCNWVGAGGIVFDKNGNGDDGITVRIRGTSVSFNKTTTSGSAPFYSAVGGGWEIKIGNNPVAENYEIRLQNSSGTALSDWTQFSTKNSCSQNLVLINFNEN